MNRLLHQCGVALTLCLAMLHFNMAGAQSGPAQPKGISFYVLRVIYPASARKGVILTAYNNAAEPYLVQSWIRPVDPLTGNVDLVDTGTRKMPFIVTPPLARLEAKGQLTLRIRHNGEPLPGDRESVFFISMKAIPASQQPAPQEKTGQMMLTIVSSMKVFYRPEGLAKRAVADVANQLRFRREGDRLVAANPTPYWLTFSRLRVGDVVLPKAQLRLMVPPKGQQSYRLPKQAVGTVIWQLIDEDGWDTPPEQQLP
ncbi:fimbrial chaperone protein [Chania multitudinisentens RB-25]|uniref:Fimbrial chaperone protein n=1 Tax=Chania multitudinisentens RB-25 TaxID=1441930 RepID=W0L7P7_9GAMM|nr:molecular chaperone [Chania multitudinisentens]AHG18374.1 fimbrial chaperone protein [Chania multitudinisentens RB-25]